MLLLTYKPTHPAHRPPWNKGKLVGPKPPFKLQEIWAIRIRLDLVHRVRELAMFNLAIDSKLRGCDLVRLKVSDVMHGRHAVSRALVVQHKTQQPVRFEVTEQTRDAIEAWIDHASLSSDSYLFPSRSSVRISRQELHDSGDNYLDGTGRRRVSATFCVATESLLVE